jgi:hypothetical protein
VSSPRLTAANPARNEPADDAAKEWTKVLADLKDTIAKARSDPSISPKVRRNFEEMLAAAGALTPWSGAPRWVKNPPDDDGVLDGGHRQPSNYAAAGGGGGNLRGEEPVFTVCYGAPAGAGSGAG